MYNIEIIHLCHGPSTATETFALGYILCLRFLDVPEEKWYDIKITWHGERLLKCLTIHIKIILCTRVKCLSILALKRSIITIEVNGNIQLFNKNVPKIVRF